MTDSLAFRAVEAVLGLVVLVVAVVFLAVVEFDATATAHLAGLLVPAGALGLLVLVGVVLGEYTPISLALGLVAGLTLAVTIWTGLGVFSPEEGVFFDGLLVNAFGALLGVLVIARAGREILAARAANSTGGDPLGDY